MKPQAIGQAGEHLVCADLIMQGYRAHLAEPSAPYDVVLDTGDRLLRVQVKATTAQTPRPSGRPCYQFELRRRHGKQRVGYDSNDFDLVALVALDIRRVGYQNRHGQIRLVYLTKNTRGGPPGTTFDDLTMERAL